MKLFGILAGCFAGAQAGGLGILKNTLRSEFQTYQQIQSKTTIDPEFLVNLESYVQQDRVSHGTAKGVRGVSLMPSGGQCGLHWDLCPNMCNLEQTLENYFTEIVGNKMEQYQAWKSEVATKKREIVKDLKGKLHQVEGLEADVGRNGMDLEKRQDLFIGLLNGHLERANQIHERLLDIKDGFEQIGEDFSVVRGKVSVAHDDCYDQAPCMAVPKCKLGVASGESCADIAKNALDLDNEGETTLNMETAVHIIQPTGLAPTPVICSFDYTGTGYTVVQNRQNDSGEFTGDFENGFGTAVGYDDAECDSANYYLGNKYIRAITESDSSLKVKHHGTSVEQWNTISMARNNLNLRNPPGKSAHVCGDDQITANEVTLGNGGINGLWTGPTQVMIGKDMDKEMDADCVIEYDTYDTYNGTYDDTYDNYQDKGSNRYDSYN